MEHAPHMWGQTHMLHCISQGIQSTWSCHMITLVLSHKHDSVLSNYPNQKCFIGIKNIKCGDDFKNVEYHLIICKRPSWFNNKYKVYHYPNLLVSSHCH